FAITCAPAMEVWSVDDDPQWLARTSRFLREEGIATTGTILWEDFAEQSFDFDLVLHDLGSMTTRESTLPAALSLVRPGGVMVLDDLHFSRYRRHVEKILAAAGIPYESAEQQTLDMLGRYSWLAFPGSAPDGSAAGQKAARVRRSTRSAMPVR